MELVIANENNKDLLITEDYELDCSLGDDENTLEITLSPDVAPPACGYAYIDGTECGGTIDSIKAETTRSGGRVITCTGRSWTGFLAAKRLVPDTVNSHIIVNGKFCDVVEQLLARCSLGDLFRADPTCEQAIVNYQFDRFIDLYNGLRKMCAANGLNVALSRHSGYVWISATPAKIIGNEIDNDLLDFDITENHRVVNHLVCAGEGEGTERTVLHLYADKDGNVSKTQTIFGLDEIVGLYEYNSADAAKLEEDGKEKLKNYQTPGAVEVKTDAVIPIDVGDTIMARDNATNMLITAEVIKKIIKVESGVMSCEYEVGASASYASSTYSSSSGIGGGGGGHAYYAGDGIKLENFTFSAEVNQAKLDAVDSKATRALTGASNAEAAAAAAEEKAANAETTASTAKTIANNALAKATKATTDATAAKTAATAAEEEASQARDDAASAVTAASAATTVATEAKTAAASATLTANNAVGIADAAQDIADEAATKSDSALADASTAKTTASSAKESADSAKATAAAAKTVAEEAKALAEEAKQIAQDAATGSFLAAHPVGAIFHTVKHRSPALDYGGTWKEVDCLGGYMYERTA